MKNKFGLIILYITILLLSSAPLYALEEGKNILNSVSTTISHVPHNFRNLSVNDGFERSAVLDVIQSEEGLMWFVAWDGLYCYDGYKLKPVYQPDAKETITRRAINCMVEGSHHRIWMGRNSGIQIWDIAHQKLIPFDKKTADGKSIETSVSFLYRDREDNIWIFTGSQQLFLYSEAKDELVNISHLSVSLKSGIIRIYQDNAGTTWALTGNDGIFSIDRDSDTYANWKLQRDERFDFFNNSYILSLFQDSQQNYWVGTNCVVYQVSSAVLKSNHASVSYYKYPSKSKDVAYYAVNGFVERNHTVYAATDRGLLEYDMCSDKAQWIIPDRHDKNSINNSALTAIAKDWENGLWITTFFGGVHYLSPTVENFSMLTAVNENMQTHPISGVTEDAQHNIWLGTEDNGVFLWNRKNNTYTRFNLFTSSGYRPCRNNVQSVYADQNTLYVGMFGGGMDVVDIPTLNYKNYSPDHSFPDKLPSSVYCFQKVNETIVLVGTIDGLYQFNTKTNEFRKIKGPKNKINNIVVDSEHRIWISTTSDGIYLFSDTLQQLKHIQHKENDSTTIFSGNISTLAVADRIVYFGTETDGVWKYDMRKDKFCQLSVNIENRTIIYKILPVHNNLWISTNKGLVHYDIKTQQTKIYKAHDGLCSNQFKINSGIQTADSLLILGTVNGVTGFNPHTLISNKCQPRVLLTKFYLFNKPISLADETCPIKEHINYSDHIDLNQKHNNFSFQFGSSSYSNPEKNKFEYKLEPFEKEWQAPTEGNNMASYTNLPANDYVLHVRTSNGESGWSSERLLSITIHPYWWASIPMKLLYLLVALLLTGFVAYRYVRKKNKELYMLRLEKEQEVYQSKMQFFTFMIHEIRTPLTLIVGPLTDIMNKKGKVEDFTAELNIIKRNSGRLLALVNQLLDFRKVEEKSYDVQVASTDLKNIVLQVVENFKYQHGRKDITFIKDFPEEECWACADREAMTKVVTNLLSNACKFTKDKIAVGINQSADNKSWQISVKDNGPGIEEEHQSGIFKSFYQVHKDIPNDYIGTGVGLFVVKQLMELQGGSITVESVPGNGACFIAEVKVSLPPEILQNTETEKTADVELVPDIVEEKNISEGVKSPIRLLVVEDNADIRNYVTSVFLPKYQVDACENGKEALTLISQNEYHLIVTDLMMPVMDGLTLTKLIKTNKDTSHIPVVILTAKDDEDSQLEGFENQADAYVIKPFSAKVLLKQVASILYNREQQHLSYSKDPETTNMVLCNNDLDKQFMQKLDNLIDEHIMDSSISIDELAYSLCMGRTTFYQKVKGIANLTPNEYISTYKLKKAANMLKQGTYRINEVYYRIGFTSSSYFAKKFTSQFGISPSEYIKNNVGKTEKKN